MGTKMKIPYLGNNKVKQSDIVNKIKCDMQKFTDSQLLELQSAINERIAFRQLPDDILHVKSSKGNLIEEQSFTDIQRLYARINELTGSLHYSDNKIIDLVNWYISMEERISQLEKDK